MSADTYATLLILGSAFLHAVWNAAVKKSDDKFIAITFITGYGAFLYIPFAFFVPFPSMELWTWIAASVITHLLYQLALSAAHEHGPLTTIYPIARGTGPMLVALASYFILEEYLSALNLMAIAILVGGIFIAAGQSRGHVAPKAILYALATGTMIAGYTLVDGLAVKRAENAFSFIVWAGIAGGPAILLTGIKRHGIAFVRSSLRVWKTGIPCALMAQGGYAMALLAFSYAALGEIAALRETSIIFATLIGALYLGESFNKTKLVSVGMIMAGAVLLKIF